MKDINLRLNHLLSDRKLAVREVITPERAEKIAQSVYSQGASKELSAYGRSLAKERLQYEEALGRNQPSEFNSRRSYQKEAQQLETWNQDLLRQELRHQEAVAKLEERFKTPEAMQRIEEIKFSVLKKNEPAARELEDLDIEIEALRNERSELIKERIRVQNREWVSLPRRAPEGFQDHNSSKLKRSVQGLENDEVKRGSVNVRIISLEQDYER